MPITEDFKNLSKSPTLESNFKMYKCHVNNKKIYI